MKDDLDRNEAELDATCGTQEGAVLEQEQQCHVIPLHRVMLQQCGKLQ